MREEAFTIFIGIYIWFYALLLMFTLLDAAHEEGIKESAEYHCRDKKNFDFYICRHKFISAVEGK